MSKRSAARREEYRQERIEAIGKAMVRFATGAGAGVQVTFVALAEVAVDALDEYDHERRLDMEAAADERRAKKSGETIYLDSLTEVIRGNRHKLTQQIKKDLEAERIRRHAADDMRAKKSEKTTSEPLERGPIVFDFAAIRGAR